MTSMEWKLKRCCTSSRLLLPCCVDRLTSLPDELLSRILSLMPTKDSAAMQVLSKRVRRSFSWITNVDLDESPVSHCIARPHLVERFPLFESFIDNVLTKLSPEHPLTRFRLRLGFPRYNDRHICEEACFPDLVPARVNSWISYPLAHSGLRELDLSFHLSDSNNECKLPFGIFVCQSLEVLRLDSHMQFDAGAETVLICLPNLKLLHLCSFLFTQDDFVCSLVSSCPVLEDLSITGCVWEKSDHLTISSHSLQRMVISIVKRDDEKNSDFVLIDTPNLKYLNYEDNLPCRYYIAHFNALTEARISYVGLLQYDTLEASSLLLLSLVRALCNVQHLSLLEDTTEVFTSASELTYQLPLFPNLRTLKLGTFVNERRDIVLLSILHCSPSLETLVFPEGLFCFVSEIYANHYPHPERGALEAEGWRTTQTIPSCFLTHLKRIELSACFGIERELNMIKFLLSKALVLKELVLRLSDIKSCVQLDNPPNLDQFTRRVEELPRASNSCSIIVQR